MALVFKYPCADCGIMLRENKLGWCDHEDSEYYCPTCWDDDTTTLPPPPADMVAEAEKENEKYIHELFAKVMTIREAQKIIQPVIDKKFAHPCAKMMDDLIAEYWCKPTHQLGLYGTRIMMGHFEYRCAAYDRKGYDTQIPMTYENQMLVDTRCWNTQILFGKGYWAYADECSTSCGLVANYRTRWLIEKAQRKGLTPFILTKKGTIPKRGDRFEHLNQMCDFFGKRGCPFELIAKFFKKYKYDRVEASWELQNFINRRKELEGVFMWK
jgi:hypothetical protein